MIGVHYVPSYFSSLLNHHVLSAVSPYYGGIDHLPIPPRCPRVRVKMVVFSIDLNPHPCALVLSG